MRYTVLVALVALAWLALGLAGCSPLTGEQVGPTVRPGSSEAATPKQAGPTALPAAGRPSPTAMVARPRLEPTPSAAGRGATPAARSTPGTPSPTSRGSEVERLVQLAKQDLARRTGVPEDEIEVVEVSAETWRDSSLGCPQPGRVYAQVLTEGYRIVLEAGGRRHEYHTDSSRVVLCSAP